MLFRRVSAAVVCCALAFPALAADFTFSNFAKTVDIGSISVDNAKALPAQPVSTIAAGKLTVTLETPRIGDVQAAFGGTVLNDAEAGNCITWLCDAPADATLWFSAFTGDGTVSQVTSDADTDHAAGSGCSQTPAEFAAIDYGIPGLGAPLADVTTRSGAVEDDLGLYGYSSTVTSRESPDFKVSQYVVVTARAGAISGITVGQTTSS